METMLVILLVLAVAGDVMLAVALVRLYRSREQGSDDSQLLRSVQDCVEQETEVLADQLRAMQGEIGRNTVSSLRDLGTMLAETQRQGASASTARLESIDRAGAARQKAANDAVVAQLSMLETRLKNLEDSNAARLDGVRGFEPTFV